MTYGWYMYITYGRCTCVELFIIFAPLRVHVCMYVSKTHFTIFCVTVHVVIIFKPFIYMPVFWRNQFKEEWDTTIMWLSSFLKKKRRRYKWLFFHGSICTRFGYIPCISHSMYLSKLKDMLASVCQEFEYCTGFWIDFINAFLEANVTDFKS